MNCAKEEMAALGSLTLITVCTVSVGVKSNTEPESLESTKLYFSYSSVVYTGLGRAEPTQTRKIQL